MNRLRALLKDNKDLVLASAVVLGFAVRLWLVLWTWGNNDAILFQMFGESIAREGVSATYIKINDFNHPPLIGYLAAWAVQLAPALGTRFSVLFKVLPMAGEVLTAVLLYKVWQKRAEARPLLVVALFAWNLNSIMVSGYQCQTDPLCAALSLLCFYYLDARRPLACGLALAATLNVKLLPLVTVPVLFFMQPNLKSMVRFALGASVAALPFIPFIISTGGVVLQRTIGYTSYPEQWGIIGLLNYAATHPAFAHTVNPIGAWYFHQAGRYVVMALIVCLSLVGRFWGRWNAFEMGALAYACFLVFAPGFCLHYTVYLVPFLLLSHRPLAMAYSTAAGVFVLLLYRQFWNGNPPPYYSHFSGPYPMPAPIFGFLAWELIILFIATMMMRLRERAPEAAPA